VPGAGTVQGEVFEVPDDVLVRLDKVEGVPDWYRREKVDGMWVYIFNQALGDAREIASGIWPI
jgi:gamma-glutamylcyclotransferase (GGCT)/AIG2-like uncharacterized protein YtfP